MDDMNTPNYEELTDKGSLNISFTNPGYLPDKAILTPPSEPHQEFVSQDRTVLENLGSISAEEIRAACFQYASENCCYGSKFARDAAITDISNGCAYHYRLETYGEERQTFPQTTPHIGGSIDGSENGPPPNPWDIPIPITKLFKEDQKSTEVPHTDFIKRCNECGGGRRVGCKYCYGVGSKSCYMCSGAGRRNNETCHVCHGLCRESCIQCSGSGQVECGNCEGCGNFRHFTKLTVTWKNHVSDFVSDTSNLPKEQILKGNGREILKEEQPKVYPINHCLDPLVNQASADLVVQHNQSFPNEVIRMQRHTLRAVPLTKANYLWKEKQGEFYVFGFQNKVYFENYPQKCCCCTCC